LNFKNCCMHAIPSWFIMNSINTNKWLNVCNVVTCISLIENNMHRSLSTALRRPVSANCLLMPWTVDVTSSQIEARWYLTPADCSLIPKTFHSCGPATDRLLSHFTHLRCWLLVADAVNSSTECLLNDNKRGLSTSSSLMPRTADLLLAYWHCWPGDCLLTAPALDLPIFLVQV
jgi:hypothetical protein